MIFKEYSNLPHLRFRACCGADMFLLFKCNRQHSSHHKSNVGTTVKVMNASCCVPHGSDTCFSFTKLCHDLKNAFNF